MLCGHELTTKSSKCPAALEAACVHCFYVLMFDAAARWECLHPPVGPPAAVRPLCQWVRPYLLNYYCQVATVELSTRCGSSSHPIPDTCPTVPDEGEWNLTFPALHWQLPNCLSQGDRGVCYKVANPCPSTSPTTVFVWFWPALCCHVRHSLALQWDALQLPRCLRFGQVGQVPERIRLCRRFSRRLAHARNGCTCSLPIG